MLPSGNRPEHIRHSDGASARRSSYSGTMTTDAAATAPVSLDEIELDDIGFWTRPRPFREAAFQTLRDHPTLTHWAERELPGGFAQPGPGYWAVVDYDDLWHVSRNPQQFISGKGSNIPDMSPEATEFFGSMIAMDDPRHFRMRSIVSRGFTPKEINRVEGYVRDKAAALVTDVLERFPDGQCDFVHEIAARLPLQIICEMMGIPAEDEDRIFAWTNTILGAGDPDLAPTMERLLGDALDMFTYAQALGDDRRTSPRDDLTSIMMQAEVDGERLSAQEFGSFFILLAVAGNETTRNAIAHGMKLLTDHPDQRQVWFDDYEATARAAVDEIVRYATPVIHFRRTAVEDCEIKGTRVAAGDKVVMFYNSANRDERVFTDPHRFDVRRPTQPQHVGFGAGGPHFCLGANLARREIAVMFDEIRRRMPTLRITGEPDYLQSGFINGIKHLPCAWDPA